MASDIGLIGLAVMGQNLVLNIESRGFSVSVFNRTEAVTRQFVAQNPGKKIVGAATLAEFVASLTKPRRVLLMVQAGAAVDRVIEPLLDLLEPGDLIADCGNSLYSDSERREAALAARGLLFAGVGVSGGEEGARKGPSIMPGGSAQTWVALRPVFERIAAQVEGQPCVTHLGPGGAGHFVKMVHNGIEYGDMQLIGEAYHLLRAAGMTGPQAAQTFAQWNQGPLQSYLIEITANALAQSDPETGQPLVELIVDKAAQKGTGRWTVVAAAEQGVAASTISAAVDARLLSAQRGLRQRAAKLLSGPAVPATPSTTAAMSATELSALAQQVHDALYAAKIVSYAQGLDLLHSASRQKNWGLDLGAIAALWRGGCIIRARFLNDITAAYRAEPGLENLLLAAQFRHALAQSQDAWRQVLCRALGQGIPVPAFSAALAYYDSLRCARLPANLLQAQRDYFGAHGYERVDRPEGQAFHTIWPEVHQ